MLDGNRETAKTCSLFDKGCEFYAGTVEEAAAVTKVIVGKGKEADSSNWLKYFAVETTKEL